MSTRIVTVADAATFLCRVITAFAGATVVTVRAAVAVATIGRKAAVLLIAAFRYAFVFITYLLAYGTTTLARDFRNALPYPFFPVPNPCSMLTWCTTLTITCQCKGLN